MEFRGRYEFAATPEQVFDAMTRPETVAACLPGCDKLVPLGEDRYQATMTLGVAAIKGRFRGTVALREQNRPESFMLQVDGKGNAGFASGKARVGISGTEMGSSIEVQANARVGGPVARVGQRLLVGTAKLIADKFFSCLRKQVEAESPPRAD